MIIDPVSRIPASSDEAGVVFGQQVDPPPHAAGARTIIDGSPAFPAAQPPLETWHFLGGM
jgi:hypothetical protein